MRRRTTGILLGVLLLQGVLFQGVTANEWAATDEIEDGRLNEQEEEELEQAVLNSEKAAEEDGEDHAVIGITIPDSREDVWIDQAKYISQNLEELGYDVDLRFAWGESETQVSDLRKWIDDGIAMIIVNPVDVKSEELRKELDRTTELRIPVLCLEQLIRDTEAEDYLVTYDYLGLGSNIGEYIIEMKKLEKAEEPCTIEFLFGDRENQAAFLYSLGLLEKLEPYLEDGTLICRSGETDFVSASLQEDTVLKERERFNSILQLKYPDAPPDIICAFSDEYASVAIGVIEKKEYPQYEDRENRILVSDRTLVKEEETETGDAEVAEWPLITGNGASLEGMNAIMAGKQAVSAYHNTVSLAETCAKMVDALMKNEKIEGVVEQYDNGMKVIPACVSETQMVDLDNYKEILIDTGVYVIEPQFAVVEQVEIR